MIGEPTPEERVGLTRPSQFDTLPTKPPRKDEALKAQEYIAERLATVRQERPYTKRRRGQRDDPLRELRRKMEARWADMLAEEYEAMLSMKLPREDEMVLAGLLRKLSYRSRVEMRTGMRDFMKVRDEIAARREGKKATPFSELM